MGSVKIGVANRWKTLTNWDDLEITIRISRTFMDSGLSASSSTVSRFHMGTVIAILFRSRIRFSERIIGHSDKNCYLTGHLSVNHPYGTISDSESPRRA